ncbi:MAG: hypothetical protein N3E51_02170 [Candidatus Micrarchaeota archaeon]|nr:hypothetical protein [Candidatus Micrarchaeota archaeon]
MVAFEFNFVYQNFLVLISALVPGLAVGIPLLRKSELSVLEKVLISFFLGLVIVPSMLFFEALAGAQFSLFLVLVNIFVVCAAGIFWGMKEGAFRFEIPKIDIDALLELKEAQRHLPSVLLLLAVLVAFWLRIQTYSPIYAELDPYWYVYGTGQIIREGSVPPHDDTAWWPEAKSSHRDVPLKMYLEAHWYALYTGGGPYNNYLLFVTSSWLPPIAAAMASFGAYLLFSAYAGRRYGLFAAYLLAFLPITMFKMQAGVNEAAPYGVMAIFVSLGTFALAAVKKDMNLGVVSSIAFFAGMAGSNYAPVASLALGGFVALQALDYFVRGKKNHQFLILCAVVAVGIILGRVAENLYTGGISGVVAGLLSGPIFIMAGALALAYGAEKLVEGGMPQKRRAAAALACLLAFLLVIIVPSPLGKFVKSQLGGYVAAADFNAPLERTIAEQGRAGASFEGESSILGWVPASHADAAVLKKDPAASLVFFIAGFDPSSMGKAMEGATLLSSIGWVSSALSNLFLGICFSAISIPLNVVLGFLRYFALLPTEVPGEPSTTLPTYTTPFSMLANGSLSVATWLFNSLLDTRITSDLKSDSLVLFFLLTATVGMVARHFIRRGEERDEPSIAILLLLFILPVSYVGLNKIKFGLFVGLGVAAAATAAIFELELAAAWLARKYRALPEADVRKIFTAFLCMMVLAQAFGPAGYAKYVLPVSFSVRYQDDPVGLAPKMEMLCEQLRAKGYYDPEICAAGIDPSYPDTINRQFNSKVCMVSQLSIFDLVPGNSKAEQNAALEARTGAGSRCHRLSEYWVETMEWINRNLAPDDRVTSWWDYGHWINYFGDRKAVLRNEHVSRGMIGRIAHDYIDGKPEDLIKTMNYYDSRYVLFDGELIDSGNMFGGKYGALNYLSCAHDRQTSVQQSPGESDCEWRHAPERVVIPKVLLPQISCVISESQQTTGVYVYVVDKYGSIDQNKPDYCLGEVTLSTGERISALYYLDRRDENGDLKLNKGFLRQLWDGNDAASYELVYNNLPVWPGANGTFVGGMEDAKTKFYTSNLYRGYYLRQLDGFDLVFSSANGEVKIYKMKDEFWKGNKEGYVDPVAAAATQ